MSKISDDSLWPESIRFSWSQCRMGDADVVWLAGEIDRDTAGAMREQLMTAAGSCTAPTIVLDLSEVSFMDAASARVVIDLWNAAARRGQALQVDGLHGVPEMVFEILGLKPIMARRAGSRDRD